MPAVVASQAAENLKFFKGTAALPQRVLGRT
jgi:hypothetical protein